MVNSVPCNRKVHGIAVDSFGNVFVSGEHIIVKYDSNGYQLKSVGSDNPLNSITPVAYVCTRIAYMSAIRETEG